MLLRRATFAILLALAAACAPGSSEEQVEAMAKSATVAAMGAGLQPDAIQIQELNRGVVKATWRAVTASGTFACTADSTFALPDCQPAS